MNDSQRRNVDAGLRCYADVRKEPLPRLAVLPWGATEPHNLHLPYLTDYLLARDLSLDAAAALFERTAQRVAVLPGVPFGSQNPGQWDKPLCLHTRYETQRALVGDIVASLRRQGILRLAIINSHGGNSFRNMVRDLAFEYPDFLIVVANTFDIVPQAGYFEEQDDHAGEMESSLVMYYHPELVSLERAGDGRAKPFAVESLNRHTAWVPRQWSRITDDTGIGNPHKASAEKGARYAAAVVERLTQLFDDLTSEKDIYTH